MTESPQTGVLVSGAGGFIALHCIRLLLEQGYRVHGTVRSSETESRLRGIFKDAGPQLAIFYADLQQDSGWAQAAEGCRFVLHIASPFPAQPPEDETELIRPAVEGTRRVLAAAAAAGAARVVLTSSTAAISTGHGGSQRLFNEGDWADLGAPADAYARSKALAERAAWDFVRPGAGPAPFELVSLNPSFVFGPLLDDRRHTSLLLVERLMRRQVPGCVGLHFPGVDVREVAAAHLAALRLPGAAGRRFILHAETLSMQAIALVLHRRFAGRGYRIPHRKIPDFFTHILGLVDPVARRMAPFLGVAHRFENRGMVEDLGITPRPLAASIIDMAESMIALGMI